MNAYKFNIYHIYYINKLCVMKFICDFYLLYINDNNKSFEVFYLQIDNIFILTNDIFIAAKENKLKKAKRLAKNREKLIYNTSIKFNGDYIRFINDNNLFFSQKK